MLPWSANYPHFQISICTKIGNNIPTPDLFAKEKPPMLFPGIEILQLSQKVFEGIENQLSKDWGTYGFPLRFVFANGDKTFWTI